ncbi:MAG: alkane 1-monooxygenase [Pseudomonadota bacterium]
MVPSALPFWISFTLLPVVAFAGWLGGWWLLIFPFYAWIVMTLFDAVGGLNWQDADPNASETLFWHKMVTWCWPPVQLAAIFGGIWYAAFHMGTAEGIGLMVSIGVVTGAVGIVFAHELVHQKNRWEAAAGELLLISVLYGHFRTEHVFVHHRYVGTPRDPVTARYNENFWHFFFRVLWQQFVSAWGVEVQRLVRREQSVFALHNPFWRYLGGGLAFLALAYLLAGWVGVGLFAVQAAIAVLHLELVNYIEHYGLVRVKDARTGKYEHVQPHHSWNASHRVTNWLVINLQRHSDHHFKPDRRYPLLQSYTAEDAPQLPFGYPMMIVMATNPMLFRRVMNPKVRAWRKQHYPEISDWSPYKSPQFELAPA